MKRKKIIITVVCVAVLFCAYAFFSPVLKGKETAYLYFYPNSSPADVRSQISNAVKAPQRYVVYMLMSLTRYNGHILPGRYAVKSGMNSLSLFREIYGGHQSAVHLTIPCVRTMEDLSGFISHNLMIDSASFLKAVKDPGTMERYGVDTANVYCLFIPNTYDIYWNISEDDFFTRMKKESDEFWTVSRKSQAAKIPLTTHQVYTLASIVDEETANEKEKPDIAGMYINRLKANMPLQADPTIKFAWKKFFLKRIYQNLLGIKSPYNTYKNKGLPPGPIRIASVKGIDAVLNYRHHDFLYMCAKEDFSGTHNFARTYSEHIINASRYAKALNQKQIK